MTAGERKGRVPSAVESTGSDSSDESEEEVTAPHDVATNDMFDSDDSISFSYSDDDDDFINNSIDRPLNSQDNKDNKDNKDTVTQSLDSSSDSDQEISGEKMGKSDWSVNSYNDSDWLSHQSSTKPNEHMVNGFNEHTELPSPLPSPNVTPSSPTVTENQKALIKSRQRRFASQALLRRKLSQDLPRKTPQSPSTSNTTNTSPAGPSPHPLYTNPSHSPYSSHSPSPPPPPPRSLVPPSSSSPGKTRSPIIRRPAAPSKKLPLMSSKHSTVTPPTVTLPTPSSPPPIPASARILDKSKTKSKQKKTKSKERTTKGRNKPKIKKKIESETPAKPIPFYAQPPALKYSDDDPVKNDENLPEPSPSPPPLSPPPLPPPPPSRAVRGRVPTKNTIFMSSDLFSTGGDSESEDGYNNKSDEDLPPKTPYGGFMDDEEEEETKIDHHHNITRTPSPCPPPLQPTSGGEATRHTVAALDSGWSPVKSNDSEEHSEDQKTQQKHGKDKKSVVIHDNSTPLIEPPVRMSPSPPPPSPSPPKSSFISHSNSKVLSNSYSVHRRPVPRKNILNAGMSSSSDDEGSPPHSPTPEPQKQNISTPHPETPPLEKVTTPPPPVKNGSIELVLTKVTKPSTPTLNHRPVKRNIIHDSDEEDEEDEIRKPPSKKTKPFLDDAPEIEKQVKPVSKSRGHTKEKDKTNKQKAKHKLDKSVNEEDKRESTVAKLGSSPVKKVRLCPLEFLADKKPTTPPTKQNRHQITHKEKGAGKRNLKEGHVDGKRIEERRKKHPHSVLEEEPSKKEKKSAKFYSDVKEQRIKKEVSKSSSRSNKISTPAQPMDWFSAQLQSQVDKKQVSRKYIQKPISVDSSRIKDAVTHSLAHNKDAVLAAKFPHKRKFVSTGEVTTNSHKRISNNTLTSNPASSIKTHRKQFT